MVQRVAPFAHYWQSPSRKQSRRLRHEGVGRVQMNENVIVKNGGLRTALGWEKGQHGASVPTFANTYPRWSGEEGRNVVY